MKLTTIHLILIILLYQINSSKLKNKLQNMQYTFNNDLDVPRFTAYPGGNIQIYIIKAV